MREEIPTAKRRNTAAVSIGTLPVGGKNPVRVKGMIKSPISDFNRVLGEAKRLQKEGVEALRIAVKDKTAVSVALRLKERKITVPLVADIHFDYRLALLAMDKGFDAIRLNPLNISKADQVRQIVREAKRRRMSIRVGVNSGGFRKDFSKAGLLAQEMVEAAVKYIKLFEKEGFFDTIVSFKSADVQATILANRRFAKQFDYPLHIGITAAGPFLEAIVKSSVGVGILLGEGMGDVIRVSLTAPSFWEVRVARHILQSLSIRQFVPEIISCPTCSRCEVDLSKIVNQFKKNMGKSQVKDMPSKIAIMGCVVNGPGEACQADIGVAFGNNKAAIFRKNKILAWTDEDEIVPDLISMLEKGAWR
ncbi:MAG: flavodoxin-dependent (E)-4-hydroxy-3-methylbut-2-enyl-diphosphate synthase [Candidatus Omnitrophota bacterium]